MQADREMKANYSLLFNTPNLGETNASCRLLSPVLDLESWEGSLRLLRSWPSSSSGSALASSVSSPSSF